MSTVTVPRWVRLDKGWPISFDPEVMKAVLFQLERDQRHFKFAGNEKAEKLTEGLPDDIIAELLKPVTEDQTSLDQSTLTI